MSGITGAGVVRAIRWIAALPIALFAWTICFTAASDIFPLSVYASEAISSLLASAVFVLTGYLVSPSRGLRVPVILSLILVTLLTVATVSVAGTPRLQMGSEMVVILVSAIAGCSGACFLIHRLERTTLHL